MLKDNEDSEIIFLDDDVELYTISRIFLQIPWEYGFSGPVGKKYEAIKDFLKWNGYEVKKWTSIVLQMAIVWISNQNTKS